ncbi:MAG TPA: LexA family transcriptional regulator [Gammaproteobacteria bacterium]|nr:LexA family transcriptional regulator [Gammaproteobacteria bacterium]
MKQLSELKITKSQIHQLANNLQLLMKARNISENDISKILDIPVMTVRRIVFGETTDPRISTLKLLADYFDVTVDSLIEDNKSRSIAMVGQNIPQFIPILDWKTATDMDSLQNLELHSWKEWQPIILRDQSSLSSHAFALESKPSMQPRFPAGTLFVIDPNEVPIDSDIVLVKIKTCNELSLRELIIDPPKWQLLPIISGSEIIFYQKNEHKILGVIVLTMLYIRKERTR